MTLFGPESYTGVAVALLCAVLVRFLLVAADAAEARTRGDGAGRAQWLKMMGTVLVIHTAANFAVGALAAWLLEVAPWALIGLATPVTLFLVAWRMLTWRTDQVTVLENVVDSFHRTRSASVEDTMAALLAAAQSLCRSREAAGVAGPPQLLYLSGAQARLLVADQDGQRLRSVRSDASLVTLDWVTEALNVNERVQFTRCADTGGTCCVIRVGFGSGPRVLLRIPTQADTMPSRFRARRLGEVISVWGETWLQQAHAPGTDEALLRDACARLTRLVAEDDPEVAEVLAEVHTIGELTAALIGEKESGLEPTHDAAVVAGRTMAMGRFPTQ